MARRLNINTAPATDLLSLPGIGNALAQRIIRHRERIGGFKAKRQLLEVPGLSERILVPIIDKIALSTARSQGTKSASEPVARTSPSKTAAPTSTTPVSRERRIQKRPVDNLGKSPKATKKKKDQKTAKKDSGDSRRILSDKQIRKLAKRIKLQHAVVETLFVAFRDNKAFVAKGKPRVEFDGTTFWEELKSRGINVKTIARKYPSILHAKKTDKYALKGQKEYKRLARAKRIHSGSAISASGYGKFRLKGLHYKTAGYKKPADLEKSQSGSRKQQLADFLNVILSKKVYKALKAKDWDAFARHYFGTESRYKKEARKLKALYKEIRKRHKKQD